MSQLEGTHIHKLAQKFGKESFTVAQVAETLGISQKKAQRYCWNQRYAAKMNNEGQDEEGTNWYSMSRQELDRQAKILAGKPTRKKARKKPRRHNGGRQMTKTQLVQMILGENFEPTIESWCEEYLNDLIHQASE